MSKAALYGSVSELRDYYSGQQCAQARVQYLWVQIGIKTMVREKRE